MPNDHHHHDDCGAGGHEGAGSLQSHDHDPHHHHGHGHSHAPANFDCAFALGAGLNVAFVAAELGFGWAANSLALVSDAIHNLSDVIGLLLAWAAAWLARRPAVADHTYGYRRASILAALGNAALLLVGVGFILWEALHRLLAPQPIAEWTVVLVAALGILVNGGTALLFMRGRHGDLNVRGAYLHMLADAGVSAAVVAGALLVVWTGALWIDPVLSLGVAVVVLYGSWGLGRDALLLALDAVPPGTDMAAIRRYLAGLPGVTDVHDLHVWALGTTETALTAHLVRPDSGLDDRMLASTADDLRRRFGIAHSTLQLERGDAPCGCRLSAGGAGS